MGLLVPRMTTTQRNAIPSPTQSLMIFNLTTNCYEWWDGLGNAWVSMSCGGGCQIPAQPGVITENTAFCNGSTGNVYTISAVTGATSYTWVVPTGSTITAGQGTISITVTFGSTAGNIDVTASNNCGNSVASSLAVTQASPTILTTTPGSTLCSGTVLLGATASSGATVNWYTTPTGGSAVATGNSFTAPSLTVTTTYYVEATMNGCPTGIRTAVIATIKKVVGIRVSSGFYGYTAGDYSNVTITFNQTPTGNTEPQSCISGCTCGGSGTAFQMQSSGTCLGTNVIIREFTFTTYPTSVTINMTSQGVHSYNPTFCYVFNDGTTDCIIASSCTADPYYYTTWNVKNTCSLALPLCNE